MALTRNEITKRWRDRNKETCRKLFKAWYQANRKHNIDRVSQWQKKNRMRVLENRRARFKLRYATDPIFRAIHVARARINTAIKGSRKTSTAELMGGKDAYRNHLESKFQKGMSWENHGRVWEIDHIQPLSTFPNLSESIEEQRTAFHFSNVQPLFKLDHRVKHSRRT